MNRKQELIYNHIQLFKPAMKAYQSGTPIYYETADGQIEQSTVLTSGGQTTLLANGDWCYNWQLVAINDIAQPARI